jgi:SAM-dependent methyltransferase
MKYNNYYEDEPHSYKAINKKLEVSYKEYYKILNKEKIDSHTQIRDAKLFASRLSIFINDILKKKKINFLDCGCGLGFIAREIKKLRNDNIHYCDPSISAKKIHDKVYPKDNFFHSDIENLLNFKSKYDVIYLREVYPFVRDDNYKNQKKLIKILNYKLNNNGILILEQMKNTKDLINNISKFKFKIKLIPLAPVKLIQNRFLIMLFFKSFFLQLLIKLIYKIFKKRISYFVLIYKF